MMMWCGDDGVMWCGDDGVMWCGEDERNDGACENVKKFCI